MAQQRHWGDTGQPLEKLEYIPQDHGWIQHLPDGHNLLSAEGYGASYWSQSGRIYARDAAGERKSFFIKLSRTAKGKMMSEGEYLSMSLLHEANPEIVPRPLAWGTFESDSDCHFFLCEFIELYDELPDMVDFCMSIAKLHRQSMDMETAPKSFGFEVTTCNGTVPQYTDWHPSWEAFFVATLKDAFEQERTVHGISDELDKLLPDLYEKVCPRLLRPLETEGRKLRPCLIHGDLWDGNAGVRADNGMPCIFDASAIWGHNEYEFHIWRGTRYKIGRTYLEEYFNHLPISPPEDDWDDRNLLYSLVADLHSSILFTQTEKFRNLLIDSVRQLVKKFPSGYIGPSSSPQKGEELIGTWSKDGLPQLSMAGGELENVAKKPTGDNGEAD